jgi:hypothetical protein
MKEGLKIIQKVENIKDIGKMINKAYKRKNTLSK